MMTFEEILAGYLANTSKPRSMREATARWWRKFAQFCQSRKVELAGLEPRHLDEFLCALQWEPGNKGLLYSANTVDQILRCTRDVLRWATAAGHFQHDPASELVLPRPPQPARRQLSRDEVRAILQSPDRSKPSGLRDAVVLAVLVEADLSIKDGLALQLGDQDRLPLESATAELLATYIQQVRPLWLRAETASKLLFLNRYGGVLGTQTVAGAIKEGARVAGLSEAPSMKCLRRSYRAHTESLTESRLSFPLNRDL